MMCQRADASGGSGSQDQAVAPAGASAIVDDAFEAKLA
jgi:hypothetical protein